MQHKRLFLVIVFAILFVFQQVHATANIHSPNDSPRSISLQSYAPRVNYDNGILIENTDFDTQNPDLSGHSDCFAAARSGRRVVEQQSFAHEKIITGVGRGPRRS